MKFVSESTALLRLIFWLLLVGLLPQNLQAQSPPVWQASKRFGDVSYFLFGQRIERFDLTNSRWLTPISLPRPNATAFAVDANQLYIAYGLACYRYNSQGLAETHLRNVNASIQELHVDGNFLFIVNGNIEGFDLAQLTSKGVPTGYYSMYGSVIAPSINKIFGVTGGLSPADVLMVPYSENGVLGAITDSVYHGDFGIGSRAFITPDEDQIITPTGVTYSTADLTQVGSFGGAVDAIDFLSDGRSIVLRGQTVRSYSQQQFETGVANVSTGMTTVFTSATTAFVFKPDSTKVSGVHFESIPHGSIVPASIGSGVSPDGLSFVPDSVQVDKYGNLLVLSKTNRCVYTWDTSEQGWRNKWVVLREQPLYLAYSSVNHALYAAYSGGRVTNINLNEQSPVESGLINMPAGVLGLAAVNEFLMVSDASGAWSSHAIVSPEGVVTDKKDWNYRSNSYEWASVINRLFFIRDDTSPKDIHYETISSEGKITGKGESPYHNSQGFSHPIRVSRDGKQVLLGSGRIYDADGDLSQIGTLPTSFTDAAWLTNNLITISASDAQTRWQRWSTGSSYAEISSGLLNGTPRQILRLPDDRYVIALVVSGKPVFRLFTASGEIIPPLTPLAPTDFKGSVLSNGVLLTWTDLPHETGYVVERRLTADSSWQVLATLGANTTSYRDTSSGASANAYYRVHGVRDDLIGEVSDPLQLAPLVPTSPSLLEAIATTSGAELSWQVAARATQYRVERRLLSTPNFTTVAVVDTPSTNYTDETGSPGATYQYRVFGLNEVATAAAPSPVMEVTVLGMPYSAIYRLTRTMSGSTVGADSAGKALKNNIRRSETGYVAVDLNSRTANQITYWTETVQGSKTKRKRYRVDPVDMQYLIIPLSGNKWQFSALNSQSGDALENHEGLWAKMSQVVGTAATYTLPKTSVQYPALPTRLSGKERFTFMGEVQSESAGATQEFKTIDCSLTLILDTKLSTSTMTGAVLESDGGLAPRSLGHAVQTIINSLTEKGYELQD